MNVRLRFSTHYTGIKKMIKKLSLSTVSALDEAVELAFNQALEAAYKDCVDRPGLSKGREITLKLVLKPDPDERHITMLDAATIDVEVGSKIPGKGISRSVKVLRGQ